MRTETAPLIPLDTPKFRYQPAMDGMRGIGVLIVMFYHYGGIIWLHGGPILIDLFFVLSAFLITNLLLDEVNRDGAVNLRGFYRRRILRLFPAMYALLAVVAVIALVVSIMGSEDVKGIWIEIAAVGLYVYNFLLAFVGFGEPGDRLLLHLWTLSMEEWFYFIWPFALIWGLRRTKNQRPLLIGAVAFIGIWMGIRVTAGLSGRPLSDIDEIKNLAYPIQVVLRFSIMRPDSLVVGCLAAIAGRNLYPLTEHKRRILGIAGGLGGAWMFAVLFLGGRFDFFNPFGSIGYNIGILCLAPVIVWVHNNPAGRWAGFLSWPVWLWLGKRSYGIYIWHMIPVAFVPKLGFGTAALFVRGALMMGISIGIAAFSWRFVETPFLKRKSKTVAKAAGQSRPSE